MTQSTTVAFAELRPHGNRRLRVFPSPGPHNALWYWSQVKRRRTVAKNVLLMRAAKVWPTMEGRVRLLRMMGSKVGAHVSWGLDATMDVLVPELVTIGDEAIIGYGTLILAHEFLQREYRLGEVEIGERAVIGANSTVLAGVRIARLEQLRPELQVGRPHAGDLRPVLD